MRVAMVTPRYSSEIHGGGEISCSLLVDALEKNGVVVDVFNGSELFPDMFGLPLLVSMYRLLKKSVGDYDVFHSYNMSFHPVVGLLSKKYDVTSVGTLNGIQYSNTLLNPVYRSRLRVFRNQYIIDHYLRYVSFFTTLCPMYKTCWILDGIKGNKINVIPNMIDPGFWITHHDHKGIRVLFVGNKAWWRDIYPVIKLSEIDDISVRVVGNGWKYLPDSVEQLSVSYDEMPGIYKDVDVLVVPYVLPMPVSRCILEAMQNSIPVITTGADILSPIIQHKKSGFLVENNLIESTVKELILDKKLYNKVSKNSLTRVKTICHPTVIVKQYLEVYN